MDRGWDSDGDGTEHEFADGNLAGTVRIGQTVRRATGPWTPAVHALLGHLADRGFDAAPRVLGFDAKGREVIEFLPGESAPPDLTGFREDAVVARVARLLRRYHDAVVGFLPPAGANWRYTVGAPREGEIICHNDVAPWNVIFAGGQPTALIDWDFAAPGPRTWDISYALWRFVPMSAGEGFGPPSERGRRIALFLSSYGTDEAIGSLAGDDVMGLIETRERSLLATQRAWGEAGVPGFAEMLRDGHDIGVERDLGYLARHREEIARAIDRGIKVSGTSGPERSASR